MHYYKTYNDMKLSMAEYVYFFYNETLINVLNISHLATLKKNITLKMNKRHIRLSNTAPAIQKLINTNANIIITIPTISFNFSFSPNANILQSIDNIIAPPLYMGKTTVAFILLKALIK